MRSVLCDVPVLALSATLTREMRLSILKALCIEDDGTVISALPNRYALLEDLQIQHAYLYDRYH